MKIFLANLVYHVREENKFDFNVDVSNNLRMDYFDNAMFGFEDGNEEGNDEQSNFMNMTSYRDSTLFLVDCTLSMFVKLENDEGEELSSFEKCMKAIQNMYQHKIYGSDRDLLGIVFYGTEKNNTGEDFPNIYMLQDLDQPSAERIKEIEKFSVEFDRNKFKKEYGHSESFAMDKVLWWCSNMFSNVTQKLDLKRIILFTRNPHPHENNKNLERLAKNKAKDLDDIGIALELIPIVLNGDKFDYSKFYGDMLMLSDEQIGLLPDPVERFEELLKTVRSKDHKRRPYTHLKLNLGEGLNISCSVYNLIRECQKPSKLKLDKKTNVETKSVTRRYVPETGEILFASDTKLAIDVNEKRVTFEQDEVKSIKRFSDPGLKLLGFKSLKSIKTYMYIKPGHFLYPDEKLIDGSTTLFRTLLDKCIERERFVLCEMIPRINTPPRLVALYPQQEELDENRMQITPPGFHVIYLPFADDFRQIDRLINAKPTDENVELFEKCVAKLRFKYNPEDFKNPSIEKLWTEIEAIALEREQPEELVDLTIPNNERIEKRAGEYLQEFANKIGLGDFTPKAKRKTDSDSTQNTKKLKTTDEIDVESEAKAGKLEKLTIPILKEYMKSKKITSSGTKKDDLIKAIKSHLAV